MAKIKITGRLTGDPELRYTPNGAPVVNFTIAENHGHYDKDRSQWVEDGTSFFRCQAWRYPAEWVAENWRKRQTVQVEGEIKQRDYQTKDGEKRTVYEVTADEMATSVPRFAPKNQDAPSVQAGFGRDPWASSQPDQPNF